MKDPQDRPDRAPLSGDPNSRIDLGPLPEPVPTDPPALVPVSILMDHPELGLRTLAYSPALDLTQPVNLVIQHPIFGLVRVAQLLPPGMTPDPGFEPAPGLLQVSAGSEDDESSSSEDVRQRYTIDVPEDVRSVEELERLMSRKAGLPPDTQWDWHGTVPSRGQSLTFVGPALSEAERYALALRQATEIAAAQVGDMAAHPGAAAVEFAKTALLLNSKEQLAQAAADITNAASGDESALARIAAAAGGAAQISGWLLAVVGVISALSLATGAGETAALAAAAGVLLRAIIAASLVQMEAELQAAARTQDPAEFQRHVNAAEGAIANLGLIVATLGAMRVHAILAARVPEIGGAIGRLRVKLDEVGKRLGKEPLGPLKARMLQDLAQTRDEISASIERARAEAARQADAQQAMSLQEFARQLGQPFLPETLDGRSVAWLKRRAVDALRRNASATLDRYAGHYMAVLDELVKAVTSLTDEQELASAGAKLNTLLSEDRLRALLAEDPTQVARDAAAETPQSLAKERRLDTQLGDRSPYYDWVFDDRGGLALQAKDPKMAQLAVEKTATGYAIVETKPGVRPINGRLPINSDYAGKTMPVSALSAQQQADYAAGLQQLPPAMRVTYQDGMPFSVEGFPQMPSIDVEYIPENKLVAKREVHYRIANEALVRGGKQRLIDRGLTSGQVDEVFKAISKRPNSSPTGWTWHHTETTGKIELVPRDLHRVVQHTGGQSVWGDE